jgi:hypothetical protein
MSHFLNRLHATWHPDQYHGWGKTRNYFEGWYFKLVTADQKQALAIIPGISMDAEGNQHAFIQVMDGTANQAKYYQFHADEFQPALRHFALKLGNNAFSAQEMTLNLPETKGQIQFINTQPWPKMLGAPGIMGWFSFVPFMECFHGIVSMHHTLQGSLEHNGVVYDFQGGKGYIEKDWGQSFPKAYVWMQSNHFDSNEQASLIASVAHIPWLNSHFIGFISGFWLEGRLFRFATYTGATKHLKIANDQVTLVFTGPGQTLQIHAQQSEGTALISPLSGAMTGKINESLQAHLQVELIHKGKRIFEGRSSTSGLELAGEVSSLT